MCLKRYDRPSIERNLAEARENVATCPIAHVDMWAERVAYFKVELQALDDLNEHIRSLIAADAPKHEHIDQLAESEAK